MNGHLCTLLYKWQAAPSSQNLRPRLTHHQLSNPIFRSSLGSNMHHVTGIKLLVLPMAVSAAVHQIAVGQGGLKFSPDSITAKVGDQVQFNFDSSLGHSVVEGDYNNPCQPLDASAFYSGTVSSGVSLATFLHSCICSP
jgi:plastocyanin